MMQVLIDGQEVGQLANDSSGEFQVEPGERKVKVAIDQYSSKPTAVNFPEGGSIKVHVIMPPAYYPLLILYTTPGVAMKLKVEGHDSE